MTEESELLTSIADSKSIESDSADSAKQNHDIDQLLTRIKQLESENAQLKQHQHSSYKQLALDVYGSILHLQDNLTEKIRSKYRSLPNPPSVKIQLVYF